MGYEYEGKSNISFSIGNKLHFWNVTDDNLREELQEVYAKAKAFDEILKVDNQATDEDRLTGEYESNIETIIGDYMEDE